MRIDKLTLRNFRCFPSLSLDFNDQCIFITGQNGTGKTSILEALHFSCYLKSFKTHLPKELIEFSQKEFSIGLSIYDTASGQDEISVGFSENKKLIKINQKAIASYKDLLNIYKIITMTEDDLSLIQGYPSVRRMFIDQAIVMHDPGYIQILRSYKATLENRNALIATKKGGESYVLWTDQLLKLSNKIQNTRIAFLAELESNIRFISSMVDIPIPEIKLSYISSRPYATKNISDALELINNHPSLKDHEFNSKRSLFGAHLDDIKITFQNKTSRNYASRGQQKLIVFLLKCAQINHIKASSFATTPPILLIDDFMTDLDKEKIGMLIPLIKQLSSQVIITSPLEQGILNDLIKDNSRLIKL